MYRPPMCCCNYKQPQPWCSLAFKERAPDIQPLLQATGPDASLALAETHWNCFIQLKDGCPDFHQSTEEHLIERIRYLEEGFKWLTQSAPLPANWWNWGGGFQIGGKQVHDANIVATMLAYGISSVPTHNTADFKRNNHWDWKHRKCFLQYMNML